MKTTTLLLLSAATLLGASSAVAQEYGASTGSDKTATADTAAAETPRAKLRTIDIQNYRPQDQRGILIFETPKTDDVPYEGFRLNWGAAFTQQYQSLSHSNEADARMQNGVDLNELMDIGGGFNNATANLYLNAQLAKGIRVALTTYLSSRHHNEAWVKDGYLLVDASPLDVEVLDNIMKYVTLKIGHFEINYGDAHFRRSDNGNAMYNPFIGNLILDAFTTEIGAEVYVRANGLMAMGGITGGEIRGNVTRPNDRAFAYLGKLGFDRQMTQDLRLRLTGSVFTQKKAISNTLYGGDRAGSRYYWVLESVAATESGNFTSGLLNPGFRSKLTAVMINPFVKYRGAELFATLERSEGRAATETAERQVDQVAVEGVYRFLDDRLYVGARYNNVQGELNGIADDIRIRRSQFGAGWFLTGNVLLKAEYVNQKYFDFPTSDIRYRGKFNGMIMEGVVAF